MRCVHTGVVVEHTGVIVRVGLWASLHGLYIDGLVGA